MSAERVRRYRKRHAERLRQAELLRQAVKEPAERPRRGQYVAVELLDPRTEEPFWCGVVRASDAPVWSRLLGRRSPAGKRLAEIVGAGLQPGRSRWLPGWAMAQRAAARLARFRAGQAMAWVPGCLATANRRSTITGLAPGLESRWPRSRQTAGGSNTSRCGLQ